MDFLYFIADATSPVSLTDLVGHGLGHVFAQGRPITSRQVFGGPGGRQGAIVTRAEASEALYDADAQTWTTMPPGEDVLIGWRTDSPPGPDDLVRDEPIDGYLVNLGNGRDWLVPVARCFPSGSRLPQTLGIGPDGAVVAKPIPMFAETCRDAERIWNAVRADYGLLFADEKPEPIDDAEAFHLACRALAINYRVSDAEVSALGLLTTVNVRHVLAAFVDMPAFLAVQAARLEADSKKDHAATPGGGDTASGPPAS